MPRVAKIKVSVLLANWEEAGVNYAGCPFLNVIAHGVSKKQARENIIEEIQFLFASAHEDGSLVERLEFRRANLREAEFPDWHERLMSSIR